MNTAAVGTQAGSNRRCTRSGLHRSGAPFSPLSAWCRFDGSAIPILRQWYAARGVAAAALLGNWDCLLSLGLGFRLPALSVTISLTFARPYHGFRFSDLSMLKSCWD
ncbi:hypothetical protein BDA96_02G306000 [Sorghum bicolor]|uniref:Uncharacterized protein n=1 Tax=Sorghum bicolor TaxID=4558 RepID=A0A921UU93_SORBI|nr:hypothetical protein BDA96_02G306000 [Sorghum bicolor]